MNARNRTIVRVSLALASLAVCAVFATFATSCANSDNNGGSGGSSAAAGTPAAGTAGGGSPATGGSPAPGGNSVTFSAGQAQGALTGYGWVAMGPVGDSVSSPTCDRSSAGGGKTDPITGVAVTGACNTQTNWDSTTALCMTGSIVALPATPTKTDYSNNWGLEIGVNANSDAVSTIGVAHTSINVGVTGAPTGLRVNIHRKGDPDTTPYCASYTGSAIPLSSFNTACWDNSGTPFTAADAPNIDKVMIQVPSSGTAITVTELCMTGITFN
jgi:hypothetical protein